MHFTLTFWSPANRHTNYTWAGKSTWCNPPLDEVEEVLLQALAGARMDPENMQARCAKLSISCICFARFLEVITLVRSCMRW